MPTSKEEKKTKFTVTEVKELPATSRQLRRNELYDDIIKAVLESKGNNLKIEVAGKDYKKLWSPLTSRIKEYNAKADREFTLKLRTANKQTFIVKEAIKK